MNQLFYVILSSIILAGCIPLRAIWINIPSHKDYRKFALRHIPPAENSSYFENIESSNKYKDLPIRYKYLILPLHEALKKMKCEVFLLIRRDTILYSYYRKPTLEKTPFNSYSMAKGVVCMLTGIALSEGKFSSIDQKIIEILPELSRYPGYEKLTLRHLLYMTSGLEADFRFNPAGDLAYAYLTKDLWKLLDRVPAVKEPGLIHEYNNVNTQLLTFALARVTGKSMTEYFVEKIAHPLGFENPAFWYLDRKNGYEKGFCCLQATAVDFAKLGKLFLNKGKWNDRQILPENWVNFAFQTDSTGGKAWDYQMHWNHVSEKPFITGLRGLFDQNIMVVPEKDLVMVTLNSTIKEKPEYWGHFFWQVAHWF